MCNCNEVILHGMYKPFYRACSKCGGRCKMVYHRNDYIWSCTVCDNDFEGYVKDEELDKIRA